MGGGLPKQFLLLHDRPVLWHSIRAFFEAFADISIILVLPEAHFSPGQAIIESSDFPAQIRLTKGGDTRFQSVKNGLAMVPEGTLVGIHDAVRCLATPALIQRCYMGAMQHGNAIPAIGAVDTIRIETSTGNRMIDRNQVKIIQTPQVFLSARVKQAYLQEYRNTFTDDSSVVESVGQKIHLVEGETTNIKITRPVDLLVAERIIEERKGVSNS
jgi:2-C-methyl-D-erythritol 4-phosphate cytidylyltransferase